MKTFKPKRSGAMVAYGLVLLLSLSFASCKKNQLSPSIGKNLTGGRAFPSLLSLPTTISDSLIAYWTCSKTAYDLSGNQNNGTLHVITSVPDRFGHTDGAYSFNGTTSYIQVSDAIPLRLSNTDFTVNAWVKLSAYNSSYGSTILSKHLAGLDNGWAWSITGDTAIKKYVQFFGPGGSSVNNGYGNDTIGLGSWHMVTTVYKLAYHSLRFYVNGVLDDTIPNIASPNALTTANLYIGRDDPSSSASGYFFHGAMSDIRIYRRAITSSEISTLYNATTAPTANLLAFWPLTETPKDLSGHDYNGTNHNMATGHDRFGNVKGAYKFNGTTSYITVPDTVTLRLNNTAFSINAWVKLVSYNTNFGSVIINKHLSGLDNGWAYSITGDTAVVQHVSFFGPGGNSTNNVYGSTVVTTGSWHMVTAIYKVATSSLSLYVDGVLDKTVTGIASPNALTTAELYIGRDNPLASSNGYFFNGYMNDLRIYTKALSSTEISQLLNCLD